MSKLFLISRNYYTILHFEGNDIPGLDRIMASFFSDLTNQTILSLML